MSAVNVKVESGAPEGARADVLLVGMFEKAKSPLREFRGLDAAVKGAITQVIKSGDFRGKAQQFVWIYPKGAPFSRLLLMGLGDEKKLDAEAFRRACGAAAREVRKAKGKSLAVMLPDGAQRAKGPELACAAVEGLMMGGYRFTPYKTRNDESVEISSITVRVNDKRELDAVRKAAERGKIIAESVILARDMANTPANDLPPDAIAKRAQSLAKAYGFSCKALGVPELAKLKMNAILAVGAGSSRPPRLVALEYNGARGKKDAPVVLVGKGIAFDSGGISLKPPADMEKMKDDMSGAAAVLATIVAAARLKLKKHLVGLLSCAENLPDSKAYRPGDVVRTASGITVEIISTDAEGRMVLCDALHYARRFNPRAVVDIATLTGACVIALGYEAMGLMGNNDDLRAALHKAGDECGERCWPLPLWEEYDELIRSDVADIKNVGGRPAGTIVGGMFLKRFVKGLKWAHLDIAGVAWAEREWAYKIKGPTGAGVRILTNFVERF